MWRFVTLLMIVPAVGAQLCLGDCTPSGSDSILSADLGLDGGSADTSDALIALDTSLDTGLTASVDGDVTTSLDLADGAISASIEPAGADDGLSVGLADGTVGIDAPLVETRAALTPSEARDAASSSDTGTDHGTDSERSSTLPAAFAVPMEQAATRPLATLSLFSLFSALAVWKIPLLRRGLRIAMTATGGLLGAGLFSRIDKDHALDHPTRDAMVHLIDADPGIHVEEIRRRLDISTSTALHHLGQLEETGFVQVQHHGGRRRYYPTGTQVARDRDAWVLLQHRTPRRIAREVMDHPGASQTELCERLGLRKPAASKQLKRLAAGGLVEVHRDGRRCAYRPADRLERVLALR